MLKRIYKYLRTHWSLIIQLIKRETLTRYKGSYLGLLWSVLTPLLMLAVYTFVFSEIFQAKWHSDNTNKLEFAVLVFTGLTTFNIFSDVVSRSPTLILGNVNYVKKVVFPLEIFPIIITGSSLVTASINFVLVIAFCSIYVAPLSWTILLLPIVLTPLILFVLGLSWFLSSLGVFLRDISHIITVLIQALMLMSPIFYSIQAIPDDFKWFYYINPITYFVENVRDVIVWGTIPQAGVIIGQFLFSFVICITGLLWFRKTKNGFADVL